MQKSYPVFSFILILLLYSLAAYVIAGCLHHDEHFQILEFAHYKMGYVDAKSLPWEFEARLRPTIQPAITIALLHFFSFIKISDPFSQVFLLRLISAAFFIYCISRLYQTLKPEIKTPVLKWLFCIFSFFLYIFPLTGVRYSSENWSSCFYILAFSYLYPYIRKNPIAGISIKNAVVAGFLFGISFLFRYQSAIMIAGLGLWLLIFQFRSLPYWISMLGAFLCVLFFGILLDYWFYGEWVSSAWNYFYVNLMEGKAASFGVEPWWWYLSKIDFSKYMVILNGSILLLISIFFFAKFKHPVTWVFFPFVFIHFLISHKETRFLYPALPFVPFILLAALQKIKILNKNEVVLSVIVLPLVLINAFAFVATSSSPVDNSTEIWKFIRTLPKQPIVIYQQDPRFYYALNDGSKDITQRFYKSDHHVIARDMTPEIRSFLEVKGDTLGFVVMDSESLLKSNKELQMVYDPQPKIVKLINYRNWMRLGGNDWKVYRLN